MSSLQVSETFGELYNRLLIDNRTVWWITGAPATGKTTVAEALAHKSGRKLISVHDFFREAFNHQTLMDFYRAGFTDEILHYLEYGSDQLKAYLRKQLHKLSGKAVVDGCPARPNQIPITRQKRSSEIVYIAPSDEKWEEYTQKKTPFYDVYHNNLRTIYDARLLRQDLLWQEKWLVRQYTNEEDLSGRTGTQLSS